MKMRITLCLKILLTVMLIINANAFAIEKIKKTGPKNKICNLQIDPAADILIKDGNIEPGGKLFISLKSKENLNNVIVNFTEQDKSIEILSKEEINLGQIKLDEIKDISINIPVNLKFDKILPKRNEINSKLKPKFFLLEVKGTKLDGSPAYSGDIILIESSKKSKYYASTLRDYLKNNKNDEALDSLSPNIITNYEGVDSKAKLIEGYDKEMDSEGNIYPAKNGDLSKETSILNIVTVQVSGYIYYQDSNGNQHPLNGVEVSVWENDGTSSYSAWEWRAVTNSAGYYSITVSENEPDNELELFLGLRCINTWLSVETPYPQDGSDGLSVWGDNPYSWTGPTTNYVVSGTVNLNYTINAANKGAAQLFNWLMQACTYTRSSYDPGACQAVWPVGTGASSDPYYNSNLRFGSIYSNANSHDVAYHEYGHLTMYRRNSYHAPNSSGPHSLTGLYSPGLCWSEGFATAYAQFVNPDGYYDAANFSYRCPVEDNDLMTYYGYPANLPDNSQQNEMRVAGALCDFYDYGEPSNGDDPANYIFSFSEIMNLIASNNFNSIIDFYNALFSSGYLTDTDKSNASRVMNNNTFNVPVTILVDMIINSGSKLLITPGITFYFKNGASLIINGTLNAIGTSSNPITFNFQSASSSNGIKVNSSGSVDIQHANIYNARYGVYSNQGVVNINNSNIHNCYYGLYFLNTNTASSNPTITNTYIQNNTNYGIYLYRSSPTIDNNKIESNGSKGIYAETYSDPEITKNTIRSNINDAIYGYLYSDLDFYKSGGGKNLITNNSGGIKIAYGSTTFSGTYTGPGFNSIYSNSGYEVSSISSSNASMMTNYWGATPPPAGEFYADGTSSYNNTYYFSSDNGAGSTLPKTVFNENDINLAYSYMDEKNYEEAEKIFKKIIEEEFNQNNAVYATVGLSKCYDKSNKNGFKEYLKNNVQNKIQDKNDSKHTISLELDAYWSEKEGNYSEAIETYNKLQNEFIDNKEVWSNAKMNEALIYLDRLGDKKKAETIFSELLSKNNDEHVSQFINTCLTEFNTANIVNENLFENKEEENNNNEIVSDSYALLSNYPNPFNPTTKIRYKLPFNSTVEVTIYDIMGREVKSFSDISNTSGSYELEWNGTNNYNEKVSSGIYLLKFSANSIEGNNQNFTKTMKLMLVK
ncbi:MAG: right-handed parallel beta-helix repeat-containing protein [Ignavibacteriae bacterium]|nr:right-handed parallel beta-helix repeat-containing protein [Ignavibacteriota bacterium]